jgi:hypothetical protein
VNGLWVVSCQDDGQHWLVGPFASEDEARPVVAELLAQGVGALAMPVEPYQASARVRVA